jgi:hypothetical protein
MSKFRIITLYLSYSIHRILNIILALVIVSATVSIIVGASTAIGVKYDEFNLFGIPVYAQSSNNNATGLPPVELEPVEPNTIATSDENSTDYLQYEDSDIGFKLDYPSDWQVIDMDLTNNAVVAFMPPDGSVEVDVKLYPRQNSESLKTFGNALKNDPSTRLYAYYRNSTTLLGGEPAIRFLGTMMTTPNAFTGEESTTNKILSMTTLLKEKKSFLDLIYYADRSNFNDYLPLVEHMIKSFQFQDTKPIIQED